MRTYNAENTIKKAIDSSLNQDYENTNIIILDDGSTDKTTFDLILKNKRNSR